MKIKKSTWVVIANGAKYLLTENIGKAFEPELSVRAHVEEGHLATHEQGTDRPGRRSGPTSAKSAISQADWHQMDEAHFAAKLAARLHKDVQANAFDELVLVADPRTLGNLRAALHQEVSKCVIGEVAKDLTNLPLSEIEKILEAQ